MGGECRIVTHCAPHKVVNRRLESITRYSLEKIAQGYLLLALKCPTLQTSCWPHLSQNSPSRIAPNRLRSSRNYWAQWHSLREEPAGGDQQQTYKQTNGALTDAREAAQAGLVERQHAPHPAQPVHTSIRQ